MSPSSPSRHLTPSPNPKKRTRPTHDNTHPRTRRRISQSPPPRVMPNWQYPNDVLRNNNYSGGNYHANQNHMHSRQQHNSRHHGGITPSFATEHSNMPPRRQYVNNSRPEHAKYERMSYQERLKVRFDTPIDAAFIWDPKTLYTAMPEESRIAIEEKKKADEVMRLKMEQAKANRIKEEKNRKKKIKVERQDDIKPDGTTNGSQSAVDEEEEEDEASKILKQQFASNQETFIGPRKTQMNARHNWSKVLLPGEGDAIAQYVSQNKRIPRRGEVGLTSDQIAQFEKLGYVMSGSTHRVIERVRKQKEALVMKGMVEEKERIQRGEKRMARENEVMGRFRNIVKKMQKK